MSNRNAQIQERLKTIPELYQKTYLKAVERKSMAAAIKAFCQECLNFDKLEIRNCTDLGCPLFQYRPYRHRQVKQASKSLKIRGLSTVESKKSA